MSAGAKRQPGQRATSTAVGASAESGFEPLAENEVTFVWRSVVDQGQLSAENLQRFMLRVSGESISLVQAKDLLRYMDADGDGRVGKEDFKNFMSIGRLEDTDPKSFMWHPNAKYRAEHGISDQKASKEPPEMRLLFETEPSLGLPGAGAGAGTASAPQVAPGSAEVRHEQDSKSKDVVQTVPAGLATVLPQSPKNRSGSPSHRARHPASPGSPLSHSPTSRRSFGPRSEKPRSLKEGSPKNQTSAASADASRGLAKPKPKMKPLGPQQLKRIDSVLENYEQKAWEGFLKDEEAFKRRLFTRFASSPDATELSAVEFHHMLREWHELARWSMPGDLRPQDSLAALEYMLSREREREAASAAAAAAAAQAQPPADAGAGGGATEANQAVGVDGSGNPIGRGCSGKLGGDEAKLPFHVWLDLVDGKYRPEEHVTARSKK